MAAKSKTSVPGKVRAVKLTNAELVANYMDQLDHPLQAEIEAVRTIIKNASSQINERIKWNAPSYYYQEDLLTFNLRAQQHVHLVFHHPAIVHIQAAILEGDYKDRRMVYFKNMAEIEHRKSELERVVQALVMLVEDK